ncbi:putative bifunctional diguanylate cyclase/phosphodiesterase [Methylobacterium oryzihabitans]|uniref:EAL domain-containing protein n=1 Tax=Methylobacterium oryzihabitans TaxID=2499852 RepID=A0A3S2VRW2_9HYPH|nr:EAL domain-containing protein [Methylobacterium oryzihabitans]RVU19428.1 EAL domain-containing protein [Methylobacterium oryzihabitans]
MGLRLKELPRLVVERRSSVLLGLLVVALAWMGVAFKHWSDLRTARLDSDRTNHNFAMVFEENVLRSIGEIDKSLLYMRRSIEMRSGSEDYGTIANTTDLLSEIIVQVAIIDAAGIMRATNAGPQPPPPTDLSDRAHFRVHVDSGEDRLYISKPVVGRASGRLSVQFSRRFVDRLGRFAGVVVASLDPGHLTKFYDKIDFGSPASISLIGSDGIVRSSGGAGGGFAVGADLTESPTVERIRAGRSGTFEMRSVDDGTPRVVTIRKVRDQPLWVSVGVPAREVYRDAAVALRHDSLIAALATLLVGLAVERLLRIEEKRSEAEAHVARLAAQDPLTGLPNRRVFRAGLAAVAERPRTGPEPQSFAVLFLDLDRFKLVNDTLGHKVGDGLLQEVGRRLSGLLGEGEMLARLGGDEFAVLMPAAGRSDAERLAHRIAEAIARPLQVESHQIRTSVSVGIAIGPDDGAGADDLLIAADLALYAVKSSRRGAFRFFDRAMSEGLEERREIEAELRRALERDELELYCQPSVALAGGRIAGFEALTRWNHPVRGPIPPSLFIPIAEECGLIHALGQWSLEEACRHAATWPGSPRIAVNLSPVQFAGQDLVAMVRQILTRTGLPASRLELEITEQMLLDNSEHTRRVLRDLKALGLRIAMDDFGTGYSSLNYLRAFPFDKIKIDRSFVAGLGEGPGSGTRDGAQTGAHNAAIVRAVIEIARSLGMHTTAEGVETPEQNRALAALGCDEAQGYFHSRPVPVAAVPGLIAQWKPGAAPAARAAPAQPRNVPNVA